MPIECVHKIQGKFYFNDETQSQVCGPYDTYELAKQNSLLYNTWLNDGVKPEGVSPTVNWYIWEGDKLTRVILS